MYTIWKKQCLFLKQSPCYFTVYIFVSIHFAATRCSDLHTCDQCQANPKCGWCNDKTNTGLGKCMEGGLQGPVNNQSLIDLGSCDKNRWFFIGCPGKLF